VHTVTLYFVIVVDRAPSLYIIRGYHRFEHLFSHGGYLYVEGLILGIAMLLSNLPYTAHMLNQRRETKPRKWILNLLGCPGDDFVLLDRKATTRVHRIRTRRDPPRAKHKRLKEILREMRGLRQIQNSRSRGVLEPKLSAPLRRAGNRLSCEASTSTKRRNQKRRSALATACVEGGGGPIDRSACVLRL